jgi:hypothetical protein
MDPPLVSAAHIGGDYTCSYFTPVAV